MYKRQISGYTSKVAGTEEGIVEPVATFSACFGAPFMPLHPNSYAKLLGEKIQKHNVNVWLVNTGWIGGAYGEGERISLKYTRAMISAVMNNELENVAYENFSVFDFKIPTSCPNVPSEILHPRKSWNNEEKYNEKRSEFCLLYTSPSPRD